MTATELRKFWHRAPFVPFDIVIPRRENLHIPHPDFLAVSPSGRIAKVWFDNDEEAAVDVILITAVEQNARNGKRKRRPRKRRN
jgi:hypothetical protein